MPSAKREIIVMSVGGSLVAPDGVSVTFLNDFLRLLRDETHRGRRFILVIGGGSVCRRYQAALKELAPASTADLDWLGISATHLNARLVQLALGELAHPAVMADPTKKVAFKRKALVAGGWKPGRSTDDDAVRFAKLYGAQTIINLSNIDYVYDRDPKISSEAKKLERLSWKQYREMFGGTWSPGFHAPFDPVASKLAQQHKARVVFLNGNNLKNVESYLSGKSFIGTVIE